MEMNQNVFSYKTAHLIGIKLLKILEEVHTIGYVYNDLKPDNICVGKFNDKETLHRLYLIDFGLSLPYLLPNGDHIPF